MVIIYPGDRRRSMSPYSPGYRSSPSFPDDDDFDDMMPVSYRRRPRNWYPGNRGGHWPPYDEPYPYPYFPYGGHHNIYQCWPPMPPKPKEPDEDEKKKDWHHHPGPSHKKAFFLVRQKACKGSSGGCGDGSKKDGDGGWKGYCEHMPAKSHVGWASDPLWYVFT